MTSFKEWLSEQSEDTRKILQEELDLKYDLLKSLRVEKGTEYENNEG